MPPTRLTPEDRVLLRSDRDPRARVTTGEIALLSGPADAALLRSRLDRASRTLPILRARVVEPVLATTEPRWIIDPDFDLDHHVRRIALPAPADHAQLLTLAEQIIGAALDPSRPLWTLTLIEGVGSGAALVAAASPLLRTETGPIDLLDLALDRSADGRPLPARPVPTDLQPLELAQIGLHELPLRMLALAAGGVQSAAGLAIRVATNPGRVVDEAAAVVAPPPPRRGSPLLARRSASRALVTLRLPWLGTEPGAARSAERAHISGVRAGLLRYHDELGLPRRSLEFVAARTPAGIARALAPAHDRVAMLGRLVPLLPDGVIDAVARPVRGADIAVSHRSGTLTGSLGRARVRERYAVGPVPGNAVTSVALSTENTLFVAVRYDTAAVRDGIRLARCLTEGFADVVDSTSTRTSA